MSKTEEDDFVPSGSIVVAKDDDDNFDLDAASGDDEGAGGDPNKCDTNSGDDNKGDSSTTDGDVTDGADGTDNGDKSTTSGDPATSNADKSSDAGELEGKTPDELKSMIEDAKAFQGRQAQEIGDLRDQLRTLSDQVNSQKRGTQTQEEEPTAEAKIKELASAFEKGTMPFEQVLLGAFQLGSDASRQAAAQEYDTRQQNDRFSQSRDSYLQQNPDFMDMLNSGALDEIRNGAPGVHNDVSAYERAKRTSTENELAALKAEHERVKGELVAAQKAGANQQRKVINTQGATTRTPNKSGARLSESQGEQMLVDKLREYRESH